MLMNIAVIPDEVVQKTNFNHLGWADIMKGNMKQYKEKWTSENGRQWKYQDNELEQEYLAFVREKQQNDSDWKEEEQNYIERKREWEEEWWNWKISSLTLHLKWGQWRILQLMM